MRNATIVHGVVCIVIPLVGFLLTGEVWPFLLLVAGTAAVGPLWVMVRKNASLTYDPTKPPKELIG